MKLSDYIKIMGIDLRESDDTPEIDDLRIIKNENRGTLESLDEDVAIMDVPLQLAESCTFHFEKHIDAIIGSEQDALKEHEKFTKLNIAQENAKEYDRRYKEHPGNRTTYQVKAQRKPGR